MSGHILAGFVAVLILYVILFTINYFIEIFRIK